MGLMRPLSSLSPLPALTTLACLLGDPAHLLLFGLVPMPGSALIQEKEGVRFRAFSTVSSASSRSSC